MATEHAASQRAIAIACLAIVSGADLHAQAIRLTPELSVGVMGTDNVRLSSRETAESDLVLRVTPSVRLELKSARTLLESTAGFDAVKSIQGTNSGLKPFVPTARTRFKSELIERWLSVEATGEVLQEGADPFAARRDTPTTLDTMTVRKATITPWVHRELSPITQVDGRFSSTFIRRGSPLPERDSRRAENLLDANIRLEQKPVPMGWAIEAIAQRGGASNVAAVKLDSRRINAEWSYTPQLQLTVAAIVGGEHVAFGNIDRSFNTRGLRIKYFPTDRSRLTGVVEQRYFGTGWDLQFSHRSPFIALGSQLSRRPVSMPSGRTFAAASSTSDMLDALFSTRQPDPSLRAVLVKDAIDRLGLPPVLVKPVDIVFDSARLETAGEVSLIISGRLTTLTVAALYRRYDELGVKDDPLGLGSLDMGSTLNRGGSVSINRRVTPQSSLDLRISTSRLEGLLANTNRSRENGLRLTYSQQLTPATTAAVVLSHVKFSSTVNGVDSSANSVLATVNHRF